MSRSGRERERKEFFEERGCKAVEVDRNEGGEDWMSRFIAVDRERQRKERWERIREAKFNKWYGRVKGKGVPGYLKKGWGESRWKRVARFRLGSEMKGSKYWEGEERREFRMYGGREETWEHVWEECREWKEGGGSWQDAVEWVLGEKGEEEGWMRELERERTGRKVIGANEGMNEGMNGGREREEGGG